MARRYCLTLDLRDDPALVAEYRRYHEEVWPEVLDSLRDAGILSMEIYLHATRMCMVMDVDDRFSFAAKAEADRQNPRVQAWETLMWRFQQALPDTRPGEKWVLMDRVFTLHA